MSTIYLIADRGKLSKKGETLRLQMDEQTTKTIFPFKTEQLVLIGNIDISTPALKLLMHHRIDTVFINKNGRFNGRLAFASGKNIFLKIRQFRCADDAAWTLDAARRLAAGKIRNQWYFIQRLGRSKTYPRSVEQTVYNLKQLAERCTKAESVASLRGLEGSAARLYFGALKHAFIPDFAQFNGRSMNPPEDNVNAVLSFIYTLLLYRVDAAVEMQGLDPHLGNLHSVEYGKRSLSFDLLEEFRASIADPLCVSLFNLGVLQENDFREVTFSAENEDFPLEPEDERSGVADGKKGVLLTRDGLRKVLVQFERKMETEILYMPEERRLNYKQIIQRQVKHYRRVVSGEALHYKPFEIK